VPVITSPQLLEALHKIGGEPGKPDQYIIPEYITRQARLVLATNAYYATADLLATAYKIYDELNTTYVRHDVLLCALLHPAISQQEKHQLVVALRTVLQAKGRASRHTKPGYKFNTYVRWAIKYGYLDKRPYDFLR
jgi:hypothetical protein